eukprot:TRINITY_DN1808_c0_g1_i1.p1 TRINITY_DN1808_c0_g1~~TRINITY_DN1808_c0_g1_i1.p1  ORF type:complete len:229 (+),score=56.60 TRINITY_DN1808_c0_g1_i1:62-748(+)
MCIRDRYQRRVHGESRRNRQNQGRNPRANSKNNNNMKVLICLTLLLVVSSTQNWATEFLGGLHQGMNLTINPDVLSHISAQSLNYTGLNDAFHLLMFHYPSQHYRNVVITMLGDIFKNFSRGLDNVLRQDYNFSVVLNYTLAVFDSFEHFDQRAFTFNLHTGADVYADIATFAGEDLDQSKYFSSGRDLGDVVNSLRQVDYSSESKVNEPILRSLLLSGPRKEPIAKF